MIRVHHKSRVGESISSTSDQGVAPKYRAAKRVCSYKGCTTVLNHYNGRKHCLLHDSMVDHTHRKVRDADAKKVRAVLAKTPEEWVCLRDYFPTKDWPKDRLYRALDILERDGYYIEGRHASKGVPVSHRIFLPRDA